jgi:phage-related protein
MEADGMLTSAFAVWFCPFIVFDDMLDASCPVFDGMTESFCPVSDGMTDSFCAVFDGIADSFFPVFLSLIANSSPALRRGLSAALL